jgi:hypothetical protein
MLGQAKLLFFFGTWVVSAFLPIIIAVRLAQLRPFPLLAYLAWRLYRSVAPAQNWTALRSFFRLDTTPYWQRQRVVFESEPEAEGVMLAFHPHGMLCCGWTVCNASATFSRFTWLVADALLALPFISDFLRWNGSDSAAAPSLKRLLGKRRNVALLPGGFEEVGWDGGGIVEPGLSHRGASCCTPRGIACSARLQRSSSSSSDG